MGNGSGLIIIARARRGATALLRLSVLLAALLFAQVARAACVVDMGKLSFIQANGPKVTLYLDQTGQRAKGTAEWYDNDWRVVVNRADVDGYVSATQFSLHFTWRNPSRDREAWYEGSVDSRRRFSAYTYPRQAPDARVSWSPVGNYSCLPETVSLSVAWAQKALKLDFEVGPDKVTVGEFRILRDTVEVQKVRRGAYYEPRKSSFFARDPGSAAFRVCYRTIYGFEKCSARQYAPLTSTGIIAAQTRMDNDTIISRVGAPSGKAVQAQPVLIARGQCKSGFVWRVAKPQDLVCVPPDARDLAAAENTAMQYRRDPNGAYGPDTCRPGFVWREAFQGDTICVSPGRRTAVAEENRLGPSRTQ